VSSSVGRAREPPFAPTDCYCCCCCRRRRRVPCTTAAADAQTVWPGAGGGPGARMLRGPVWIAVSGGKRRRRRTITIGAARTFFFSRPSADPWARCESEETAATIPRRRCYTCFHRSAAAAYVFATLSLPVFRREEIPRRVHT